jgi:hypothetical protein
MIREFERMFDDDFHFGEANYSRGGMFDDEFFRGPTRGGFPESSFFRDPFDDNMNGFYVRADVPSNYGQPGNGYSQNIASSVYQPQNNQNMQPNIDQQAQQEEKPVQTAASRANAKIYDV